MGDISQSIHNKVKKNFKEKKKKRRWKHCVCAAEEEKNETTRMAAAETPACCLLSDAVVWPNYLKRLFLFHLWASWDGFYSSYYRSEMETLRH